MSSRPFDDDDSARVPGLPAWATKYGLDDASPFPFAELDLRGVTSMRFQWIPAGAFDMGSPENELGRSRGEGPAHRVKLTRGFWLASTPVTRQQWVAVMQDEPKTDGEDMGPINWISWHQSEEFCFLINWDVAMRARAAPNARLPTEAEWEYACRAGTTSAFNDGSPCTWPVGADPALEALGWYGKNSGRKSHPVARKAANAWGLFDMHGNVEEWCADWNGPYHKSYEIDPTGPPSGISRIARGGDYADDARDCRSASRNWYTPEVKAGGIGFRPVLGE